MVLISCVLGIKWAENSYHHPDTTAPILPPKMSPVHLLEIFKTFCLCFCTAEGIGAVHLFSVKNQSQWCHLTPEWIMLRMPNVGLVTDSFSTMSCVKPELSKRGFLFHNEPKHNTIRDRQRFQPADNINVSLITLKLKLGESVRTVVISAGKKHRATGWKSGAVFCQDLPVLYCTCKLWDVRTRSLILHGGRLGKGL